MSDTEIIEWLEQKIYLVEVSPMEPKNWKLTWISEERIYAIFGSSLRECVEKAQRYE